MRVLTTQQMREADRRTIDDDRHSVDRADGKRGPSGRRRDGIHVRVAVVDARRRALRTRQQRRRRIRRRAHAARPRHGRAAWCWSGESAQVKGDARINLEMLRALGVDVVEIADAGAWELHGAEILGADLVVDALVGTGLSAPLSGLYRDRGRRCERRRRRRWSSIDLPSGLSADSPEPMGRSIDAAMTVTLGAPKLPLVLPPGEVAGGHAGHCRHRHPGGRDQQRGWTLGRAADQGGHAGAGGAAGAGLAQGRLRARADRGGIAGQDRRGGAGGGGGAAIGRGPRHGGGAGRLRPDHRRARRGVHDAGAAGGCVGPDRSVGRRARARVWRGRDRRRPRPGTIARRAGASCTRSRSSAGCRSSSTPTPSSRLPASRIA